jgi:ribosomal protein S27AE
MIRASAGDGLPAPMMPGRHTEIRGMIMNETCDRCGPAVRAAYRMKRNGELYLCGHCTARMWAALSTQGWAIWPLSTYTLAPQASAATEIRGMVT